MSMQAPYNDPNMNVDWIAERYWPNDPDRDSREARGLNEYYQRADVMKTPNLAELIDLAESLPNTRR